MGVIGFIPSGPMFRVVGKETPSNENATGAHTKSCGSVTFVNPQFRLEPTPTYFGLVSLGVLITAIPLLARTTYLGILIGLLLFLCAIWHIVGVFQIGRMRVLLGNESQLLISVPSLKEKRYAAIWLLCLLTTSAIALLLSIQNAEYSHGKMINRVQLESVVPVFGCFLLWAVFSVIWTKNSPSFRLPELEGTYTSVSQTVKEKITKTTKLRAGEPVRNWRVVRNISQEVHFYGQAACLFRSDVEGPAWRHSIRALIWYYAPVTLPLAILIVLPILYLNPQLLPFSTWLSASKIPERFELGLATIAWASWSMPFFIVATERDFAETIGDDNDRRPTTDVQLFPLGEEENRRLLQEHVSGNGRLAFQVLVLALMPALFSYFGLFPEPPKDQQPCPTCDHSRLDCVVPLVCQALDQATLAIAPVLQQASSKLIESAAITRR